MLGIIILLTGIGLTVSFIHKLKPAAKETLRVGIVTPDKPYSWYNSKQKLTGFNVELAQKIAHQNNMQVKFISGSSQALRHKFNKGEIQLLFWKQKTTYLKQKTYYKTNAYLYQPNVLLSLPNHKIGNLVLTKKYKLALASKLDLPKTLQSFKITVLRYPKTQLLIQAILQGKVKAGIISSFDYSVAVQKNPLLLDRLVKSNSFPPVTAQPLYGITSRNKKLRHQINKSLTTLDKEGVLATLSQKYFSQDWSKQ
ncbi:hypothetical protein FC81_GL001005 [Liquorilactobacillus capillatus DSM 19910]|uniref:Solute-binding protein family 3/N-terminal domain-containing protein n=2 Tax=Liquorilactobacillus capillatus TaxID=480931 RepID=A0A0R1M9R5_9LACO|nr:hypothetical protein FC81_GL001005 [Liquorilactobacillus capillatus DSM 19910]